MVLMCQEKNMSSLGDANLCITSRFDDPIGFQQVSHSTWNIWINLYRFTPVESNHIYHPKDGSSSSLSTGWMIDPESVEALVFKPDGQIGKWTFTYSSSELKITMFQKCIYSYIFKSFLEHCKFHTPRLKGPKIFSQGWLPTQVLAEFSETLAWDGQVLSRLLTLSLTSNGLREIVFIICGLTFSVVMP